MNAETQRKENIDRQSMDADIVCVGFGPATAGFLTELSKGLLNEDGSPAVESKVMPGMPPQIICYERADDIGFGVSGVVTRGRTIKESFSEEALAELSMSAPVGKEKLVYLLDPIGASRRPLLLRGADAAIKALKWMLPCREFGFEMPLIPGFMNKKGGLVLSIGQFTQWVGARLMAQGTVQIWPSSPVAEALISEGRVEGVRLMDQGTDRQGNPEAGFMPGMDIRAALTVIGDGPVGAVGQQLDQQFGLPDGHHQRDWAVGMKMVVDLPEECQLEPGTVLHTFGYPEPEIFGFFYVFPGNIASVGIFIPSWFDNPVRTSYRYLQHWMMHPYLWRYLKGGTLRSWGAKTLQESGRRGEPFLAGDGYARIGEGSGSTNVLTGSGVDEAWGTGMQLGQCVLQLLKEDKPCTRENLEATYVKMRRASWIEKEGKVAGKARDGFQKGFIQGMIGMALAGFSRGRVAWPGAPKRPYERIPSIAEYYHGKIPRDEIEKICTECRSSGKSVHDALMNRAGWPEIPLDGKLLVSQQDALLLGGKVQAPAGYSDHVLFLYPNLCEQCGTKICAEICSAQAITPNPEGGVPDFDREKCIHCGACLWNCSYASKENPERMNVGFRAGAGGLHSAEN